jgi:hypothetical protein
MTRIPQPHPNEFNKAREVRRDNDSIANFVMTLYDIDLSISDYMNEVIAPMVTEGGVQISVPIVYGNAERWNSARENGVHRDQNGQIILPMIMFNRSGFGKSEQIQTLNRFLSVSTVKRYSKKNKYDKFAVMNGVKPTIETYNTVYPDHIRLTYDCLAWTSFTSQLNEIVERFNFADDSYWGEKNQQKFKVTIGEFDISNELSANQERLVRASFTLNVEAYILPPDFANKLTTVKSYSPKRVLLMQEIEVPTLQSTSNKYRENSRSPVMGRTHLPQVSMLSEYQPLFDYLTLNEQFTGVFQSSVGGGDAIFHFLNSELVPTPNELTALITESDKYQVFINGVITPSSSYTLTNSNRTGGITYVTITIDNVVMGFELTSSDEVTIKGKLVGI